MRHPRNLLRHPRNLLLRNRRHLPSLLLRQLKLQLLLSLLLRNRQLQASPTLRGTNPTHNSLELGPRPRSQLQRHRNQLQQHRKRVFLESAHLMKVSRLFRLISNNSPDSSPQLTTSQTVSSTTPTQPRRCQMLTNIANSSLLAR